MLFGRAHEAPCAESCLVTRGGLLGPGTAHKWGRCSSGSSCATQVPFDFIRNGTEMLSKFFALSEQKAQGSKGISEFPGSQVAPRARHHSPRAELCCCPKPERRRFGAFVHLSAAANTQTVLGTYRCVHVLKSGAFPSKWSRHRAATTPEPESRRQLFVILTHSASAFPLLPGATLSGKSRSPRQH